MLNLLLIAGAAFVFFCAYAIHTPLIVVKAGLVLIGIVILFGVKLNRSTKAKMIALFGSIGFSLFLLSLTLSFTRKKGTPADTQDLYIKKAAEVGVPYDKRSKTEVVAELRAKKIDAWPYLPTYHFLISGIEAGGATVVPISGVANVTTVLCNESGTYSSYKADSHGFVNSVDYFGKGPVDLVTVGDSFAHGDCVDPPLNIAGQLQHTYKKTVNLGNSGNGPLSSLGSLVEYGRDLKPKIVVWLYCEGNDLFDLNLEKNSRVMGYLDSSFRQGLMERKPDIDRALKNYIESEAPETLTLKRTPKMKEIAMTLIDAAKLSPIRIQLRESLPDYGLLKRVLTRAKQETESWGGKMVFVYLPVSVRYRYGKTYHHKGVAKVVKELDIPFIDGVQIFEPYPDPVSLFALGLGHYSEEGYKIMADGIRDRIK